MFDSRDGSRTAGTSKMELFMIIVNGSQSLTISTNYSILNVAAILDPPLDRILNKPLVIRKSDLDELISSTKTLYYENLAQKLNNPLLQAKTYWSIFKTFYNDKKIPLIPPLLIDDKFVTDIQTKANIFNKFFAEQCTPARNGSVLPVNQIFLTQARLKSLDFKKVEILKIIRALNINKAHGYDDISIRMTKICDKSLLKPLILLFKNPSQSSCYPDIWKKSNIIHVHKKSDKQLVDNYRPISLLPIYGKTFEKLIFSKIYNFLLDESLLNSNQSGFRLMTLA